MRTIEELLNTTDSGWSIIQEWIGLAKNNVAILPCDRTQSTEALLQTQVTTRSLMGAIIYETGGLLIDNGWIRILGSGCEQLKRSIPSWNKGKTFSEFGELAPYLLIADDAVGGFYAINGGYLGQDTGNIYYFAPDLLSWESLGIGYSQFLLFCFETDLNEFYENLRWADWQKDVSALKPDHTFSFYPFLWTKEGRDINKVSKKIVTMEEAYNVAMEFKSTFDHK